ncbi:hypothetical protein ACOSQ3_013340 [Xanthoceras sorbifolium]
MKLFVWNIRRLGSPRAVQALLLLYKKHLPDLMFLVETKVDNCVMERIRVKLGFVGKLVVNSEGRSGGLCLFWSKNTVVDLLSFSRFHIDVKISSVCNKTWRFSGFYGHPDPSQRHHAWTMLRRLHGMYQLPWLVAGDFNEILEESEKQGGVIRALILMSNFRGALDSCGLEDLGFSEPRFTWSNRRDGDNLILERLDRCVGNFEWSQIFSVVMVRHLGFWRFDHRPLVMTFDRAVAAPSAPADRGRRRRHFEACWANEEECVNLIRNTWQTVHQPASLHSVVEHVGTCSIKLNHWSRTRQFIMRREIDRKRRELDAASALIHRGS